LITAKQRGSTNALVPVARELIQRGHDVKIYATGNETESAGFSNLAYEQIDPPEEEIIRLVQEYQIVITGLHGYKTSDGQFIRAANQSGIPTIAVQDQNANYSERLGKDQVNLPQILAVMDNACVETAKKELGDELGEEIAKRCRVVGWTAFDGYAQIRERFTAEDRARLLFSLGLNPDHEVYFHATQNIHPLSKNMKRFDRPFEQNVKDFLYELGVTQFTFEAASDLGLKLTVKPHPGEEFRRNYTEELAKRHDFTFILPRACSTQQLMLAAYSVTAGRSTCLTEAALLDRNAGGIIPEMGIEWITPFPPMALRAIPYTQTWEGIKNVLAQVTAKDEEQVKKLAEGRKNFSVDGKATKRLADLIEELSR